MKYWQALIPYQGHATVIIEGDEKPSMDKFRNKLQQGNFDRGMPSFQTMKMKIEEMKERDYKNVQRMIKRRSYIEKLAKEITKN